jgi:hypothetical protein
MDALSRMTCVRQKRWMWRMLIIMNIPGMAAVTELMIRWTRHLFATIPHFTHGLSLHVYALSLYFLWMMVAQQP